MHNKNRDSEIDNSIKFKEFSDEDSDDNIPLAALDRSGILKTNVSKEHKTIIINENSEASNNYHCAKCNIYFKNDKKHTSHLRKIHKKYKCQMCFVIFNEKSEFEDHIDSHKKNNLSECNDILTIQTSNTSKSTIHKHSCDYCSRTFRTIDRLNLHLKKHEKAKRFQCEACPSTHETLAELNRHAAIHSGEFRCDTCHKAFKSGERLTVHSLRHDIAGKPYACFVCSLGYRSSQSLNKHLATVHRNEDVPKIAPQHLCTLCGQVFEMKDKLNRHLKESHIVLVVGEIQSLDKNIQPTSQITTKNTLSENNIKGPVENDINSKDNPDSFIINLSGPHCEKQNSMTIIEKPSTRLISLNRSNSKCSDLRYLRIPSISANLHKTSTLPNQESTQAT